MAAGVTHREWASLARPDLWVIPSELQYYSAPIPIISKRSAVTALNGAQRGASEA